MWAFSIIPTVSFSLVMAPPVSISDWIKLLMKSSSMTVLRASVSEPSKNVSASSGQQFYCTPSSDRHGAPKPSLLITSDK